MIDCAPATCETLGRAAPQLIEAAMPGVVAEAVAIVVAANTDKTEAD